MMRLGQKFTTAISSWFSPGFTAAVMSTRKGGVQAMPQDWPLTFTSASSRTSPRSRKSLPMGFAAPASADLNTFEYLAVPE